jgi:hypothetical protein
VCFVLQRTGNPLASLTAYSEEIRPLSIPLLIVFFVYGGCLMVALTLACWTWSGMASIGLAFLIFAAPIMMIFQAILMRKDFKKSKTHRWIFRLSIGYPFLVGAMFLVTQQVLKYTAAHHNL